MDTSIRQLRIIQSALLISIVLYVFVALHAPVRSHGIPLMILCLALLSGAMAIAVFVIRTKMVGKFEALLATQPDDKLLLSKWRSAYVLMWALCEAIAMYGLTLRYLGFTMPQVAPFFAAGFLLMLVFPARRPAMAR